MSMSNVRIIVAVVIMVGCFTVIYPRFFHPVILKVLGMAPKVEKKQPTMHHPPNKPIHDGHGPPDPSMHIPDDVRRHMKPGPHPGMRAAAEMNKQNTRGSGGRGGIMGMVLPVYAIGIIGYLVYTLVKVFNKKGTDDYGKKSGRESSYGDRRHNLGSGKDGEDELTDLDQLKESSEKLSVLENLLSKADDKNITAAEVSELQKRLEDTERQMARILHAMQTVSTKVDKNVILEQDSTPGDKENDENKTEEQSNPEDKDRKPGDVDVSQEKTTDTEKTEENKTDDDEITKTKSCDEDTENITEEDVVILDKQTDKMEEKEETTVRHRKTHVESDNS